MVRSVEERKQEKGVSGSFQAERAIRLSNWIITATNNRTASKESVCQKFDRSTPDAESLPKKEYCIHRRNKGNVKQPAIRSIEYSIPFVR